MARGTTLLVLIQMLRRELKIAEAPALGQNTRETHAYHLRSHQERLHREWKWPYMRIHRDVMMVAGERYYAFPEDMDAEDVICALASYGGAFVPIQYGVTPLNYNGVNSEIDSRNDPPLAWELYRDPVDQGDMFEVWPIPASATGSIRFRGTGKLRPLIADADVCDLDDLLIVYAAAAELAPDKERARKEEKLALHYAALKARMSKIGYFVVSGEDYAVRSRREIVVTAAVAEV